MQILQSLFYTARIYDVRLTN